MTMTIDPPVRRGRPRKAAPPPVSNGSISPPPPAQHGRPRKAAPAIDNNAAELLDLRGKIPEVTPEEVTLAKSAAAKVVISPPRMQHAVLHLRGIAPYVQHRFSTKAQQQMEETQRAGTQARSRKKREARDFEAGYEAAKHISREGWLGIPAPAFRNAAIDACRLVGYKMTHAKLTIFIEADGVDAEDGTPLVRIIKGEPEIHKGWGRNANGGADLRWRPIWHEWELMLRIRWDADQFSPADVVNLVARAGLQVGVGEGRPNSPNSNGLGWGLFEIVA
jgi:hypothetical protein